MYFVQNMPQFRSYHRHQICKKINVLWMKVNMLRSLTIFVYKYQLDNIFCCLTKIGLFYVVKDGKIYFKKILGGNWNQVKRSEIKVLLANIQMKANSNVTLINC